MGNILLTGGRAPAALELARVFDAAGHRVYMAESMRGHLSEPSRAITKNFVVPPPRQQTAAYIDALKRIVIEQRIDLLIPTCEEIFYVAMGRDALSPHCTVFVEPIERLRPLHHKAMFICRAQQIGLDVPDTLLLETPDALSYAFTHWPTLVLKPAYSRFASQTIIRPRDAQSVRYLPITHDAPWVAQQFVEGQQLCTYSIVHDGHLTAHTAYRSEFTAGQGATIVFQHFEHPASLEWVQRFVAAERFTGQIAFDFIEMSDGRTLAIECNPRTISGAHLLAKSPQFADAFLDASTPCVVPPADYSAILLTGMLVYGLPTAIRHQKLEHWLSVFRASRDVLFHLHDPLPFLLQFRSIAHFVTLGYQHRLSPLAASTYDIEWNGQVTFITD